MGAIRSLPHILTRTYHQRMNLTRTLLTLAAATVSAMAQPVSIPGHSHNDYEQARPLDLAIESGLRSVEVDVHLVDGELLVAHDADKVVPGRTIESLYLAPLRERRRTGTILPDRAELILLVDFKTEAASTYQALEKVLIDYEPILTSFSESTIRTNAVRVIVSGNRPIERLRDQATRLAFIDGRPSDIGRGEPAALIPLISDNWNNHFKWDGTGTMPEQERKRLEQLAAAAHMEGKWLRLWAAPDTPTSWSTQLSAGIDFINTDRPKDLRQFFDDRSQK